MGVLQIMQTRQATLNQIIVADNVLNEFFILSCDSEWMVLC